MQGLLLHEFMANANNSNTEEKFLENAIETTENWKLKSFLCEQLVYIGFPPKKPSVATLN